MSEREPSQRGEPSPADRTLLGVPAPRVDSTAESPLRSPVFVRSGTSVADVEPSPLPRMALPDRPSPALEASAPGVAETPSPPTSGGRKAWAVAKLNLPVPMGGTRVALWKVLVPGLAAALLLTVLVVHAVGAAAKPTSATVRGSDDLRASSSSARGDEPSVASTQKPSEAKADPADLAQLQGKPPETLTSSELLRLADGRVEREREAARALRLELASTPARAKDKATQAELLRLASDPDTAREALATMAGLEAPLAADFLYEVWTGTAGRNDTTELSRTLVYSADVRPKASPALSVALELRTAETCEQFRSILPKALKDGDRRALHLLSKLTSKRGCGPKKTQDCFACLREQPDELLATINAVKSRRPPSYVSQ